ncbi:MAG: hypothetical protein EOO77_40400, partial [Oxalobacteraceae bacterium]
MPSTDNFDRHPTMANSALSEADWPGFQRYLALRTKGLRRAAMEALHSFVLDVERWDFEKRKEFVSWVSSRDTNFVDQGLLISNELLTRVVGPTIREWLSREAGSSLAHYLSGKYCRGEDADPLPLDAFRRSITLDPSSQQARRAFIDWIIVHAEYDQHELPFYGYLGPADEDARDLAEALWMIPEVEQSPWRKIIEAKLTELFETATAWQRFEQSGDRHFVTWCEANGGPSRFV